MKKSAVKKYYDDYITEQYNIGVNDRIFRLYEKLISLGLSNESDVVELGCGIGAVTHLIRKTVSVGQIESVDISGESIEFAKGKIKNSNVQFYEADITEYSPKIKIADFVTLFDVIEHIPVKLHEKLFLNVANMLKEDGWLLVNIPSANSVEWDQIHAPEALQIIDQPIPLDLMVKNCLNAGLEIIKFESYSIWVENDYNFFLIRKKKDFKNEPIQLNTIQKAKRKAWRIKFKSLFKY
jgi:SAM-dependent methyltransferase